MLERGFWLYVWDIRVEGIQWLYVGRTGDESSPSAAAPYDRFGQHLGRNKKANALARNLKEHGVDPTRIDSAKYHFFGPLFPEAADMDTHRAPRDATAALEKALAESLKEAGYRLLNTVRCRRPLDEGRWAKVKDEFSAVFPKLKESN